MSTLIKKFKDAKVKELNGLMHGIFFLFNGLPEYR
jgi:hypothetical protein